MHRRVIVKKSKTIPPALLAYSRRTTTSLHPLTVLLQYKLLTEILIVEILVERASLLHDSLILLLVSMIDVVDDDDEGLYLRGRDTLTCTPYASLWVHGVFHDNNCLS